MYTVWQKVASGRFADFFETARIFNMKLYNFYSVFIYVNVKN